jgi:hypothetical protein
MAIPHYRIWSPKKAGTPKLFKGKNLLMPTTPYAEAGLKWLKKHR